LIGRKKAQKAQKIRINVLCFLCLFAAKWLLEFDLVLPYNAPLCYSKAGNWRF